VPPAFIGEGERFFGLPGFIRLRKPARRKLAVPGPLWVEGLGRKKVRAAGAFMGEGDLIEESSELGDMYL